MFSRNNMKAACIAAVFSCIGWLTSQLVIPALAQQTSQNWSGWVGRISDSNCGVMHKSSDPKQCTLACVKGGAKYSLVIGEPGDKVFTLDGNASEFEKLAGSMAKVQGDLNGNTINVSRVEKQ